MSVSSKTLLSFCKHRLTENSNTFRVNLDLLNSNASPLEDVTVQVERSPFLGHCVGPSFDLHRHLQHG